MGKNSLFIVIILFSITNVDPLEAQYLPVHPTNQVYSFITELSNTGVIIASDYAKPMSRIEIAQILNSIDASKLNQRQKKELDFYLMDFRKELVVNKNFDRRLDMFYYRDSLFSFTVNPILGGNLWSHNDGVAWHWWNGAEAWATAGKWALWGSLRDNHESERLTQPDYMNLNYGGANFKSVGDGQVDYWEFRGGVTYDFGIGNIGIIKDHFSWGSNYHGANILSGRTQSFAHLSFNIHPVEWFEFRYIHGWLVSEVIDSSRSFNISNSYGTDFREVYHNKYLAANLFTFRPFKKLDLSFGNSIIYDYGNPHLAYFIPVMFYKAVDHHLSSGIDNMNSQIFIDVSSRMIPNLHLYGTLFLDELAVKRITDPDDYNLYSFKAGGRISGLIPNLFATAEFTITNALTFRHYIPTTTFESNRFNLGHYLEDNARELYLNLGYRPYRNMEILLEYTNAEKGPDHTMLGSEPRMKLTPFTPIVWEMDQVGLNVKWQVIHDVYVRLGYTYSHIRGEQEYLEIWTPEFWRGERNVISVGGNINF